MTQPTRCRICGGSANVRTAAGATFDRCSACGFAFLRDGHEPRDYWRDEAATSSNFWTRSKAAYFDSTLSLLAPQAGGRRLLDVGGGVGFFAERALERGWDAFSLDVSPVATKAAADRLGSDRALDSVEGVERGSFDVATMWCVVAHVDDPAALLRSVADALRSGGVVWLTTPNFSFHRWYGVLRRGMGRPIDFRGDDHRGQFTPTAMTRLLAGAGFGAPSWHYRGVTKLCAATMRSGGFGVRLKEGWNRTAHALAGLGLPNAMSELQVTARRSGR